jgi:hypothetical protein
MSFLGDVLGFEKFNLKNLWSGIKDNPERLFLGAADPFSSSMWGKILGKDYDPLVGQMGEPTSATYEGAKKEGIDTGPGKTMHDIAQTLASLYTGKWAGGKLGGLNPTNLQGMNMQGMPGMAPQQPMQPPSPMPGMYRAPPTAYTTLPEEDPEAKRKREIAALLASINSTEF